MPPRGMSFSPGSRSRSPSSSGGASYYSPVPNDPPTLRARDLARKEQQEKERAQRGLAEPPPRKPRGPGSGYPGDDSHGGGSSYPQSGGLLEPAGRSPAQEARAESQQAKQAKEAARRAARARVEQRRASFRPYRALETTALEFDVGRLSKKHGGGLDKDKALTQAGLIGDSPEVAAIAAYQQRQKKAKENAEKARQKAAELAAAADWPNKPSKQPSYMFGPDWFTHKPVRLGFPDINLSPKRFDVAKPVGPGLQDSPADVMRAKYGLRAAEYYQPVDVFSVTPWANRQLFDGIKQFQKDRGLKPDGLMNPHGPTARALADVLAEMGAEPDDDAIAAEFEAWENHLNNLRTLADNYSEDDADEQSVDEAGEQAAADAEAEAQAERARTEDLDAETAGAQKAKERRTAEIQKKEPGLFQIGADFISTVLQNAFATPEAKHENLTELKDFYYDGGYKDAGANLEHYLGGSGKPLVQTREEAVQDPFIAEGERLNNHRVINKTFLAKSGNEKVNEALRTLKNGESKKDLDDYWDKESEDWETLGAFLSGNLADRDDILAEGARDMRSDVKFNAARKGDTIHIKGKITHDAEEDYNFERETYGALLGVKDLEKAGLAKPFKVKRKWGYDVEGTVTVVQDGDKVTLTDPQFKIEEPGS